MSAYKDLSIVLNSQSAHPIVRVGVEGCIQTAIAVKASEEVPRLPREDGKLAAYQNFSIRVRQDTEKIAICTGIEGNIQASVIAHLSQIGPTHSANRVETAADQHAPVTPIRQTVDHASRVWTKRGIHTAI